MENNMSNNQNDSGIKDGTIAEDDADSDLNIMDDNLVTKGGDNIDNSNSNLENIVNGIWDDSNNATCNSDEDINKYIRRKNYCAKMVNGINSKKRKHIEIEEEDYNAYDCCSNKRRKLSNIKDIDDVISLNDKVNDVNADYIIKREKLNEAELNCNRANVKGDDIENFSDNSGISKDDNESYDEDSDCSNERTYYVHGRDHNGKEEVVRKKMKMKKRRRIRRVIKKNQNGNIGRKGFIIYQVNDYNNNQLKRLSDLDDALSKPILLFGDNDVDKGRLANKKRIYNGGQAKVCGNYDASLCYGITTTYYNNRNVSEQDFFDRIDNEFDVIHDEYIMNNRDVVIPSPGDDQLNRKKGLYYLNNELIIEHDIGTGIAGLEKKKLLYIQMKFHELALNSGGVYKMGRYLNRSKMHEKENFNFDYIRGKLSILNDILNPKKSPVNTGSGCGRSGTRTEAEKIKANKMFWKIWEELNDNTIIIATDGASNSNASKKEKRFGGAGGTIWFGKSDVNPIIFSCPLGIGTNNEGEMSALGIAFTLLNDKYNKNIQDFIVNNDMEKVDIHVFSDSDYSIGILDRNSKIKSNKCLCNWVKLEYIKLVKMNGINNIGMHWVAGHVGIVLNELADRLADVGKERSELGQSVNCKKKIEVDNKNLCINVLKLENWKRDTEMLLDHLKKPLLLLSLSSTNRDKDIYEYDIFTEQDYMEDVVDEKQIQLVKDDVLKKNGKVQTNKKIWLKKMINVTVKEVDVLCLNCKDQFNMDVVGLYEDRRKYYNSWICSKCISNKSSSIKFCCGVGGCDFIVNNFNKLINHLNENNDEKHILVRNEFIDSFDQSICNKCNIINCGECAVEDKGCDNVQDGSNDLDNDDNDVVNDSDDNDAGNDGSGSELEDNVSGYMVDDVADDSENDDFGKNGSDSDMKSDIEMVDDSANIENGNVCNNGSDKNDQDYYEHHDIECYVKDCVQKRSVKFTKNQLKDVLWVCKHHNCGKKGKGLDKDKILYYCSDIGCKKCVDRISIDISKCYSTLTGLLKHYRDEIKKDNGHKNGDILYDNWGISPCNNIRCNKLVLNKSPNYPFRSSTIKKGISGKCTNCHSRKEAVKLGDFLSDIDNIHKLAPKLPDKVPVDLLKRYAEIKGWIMRSATDAYHKKDNNKAILFDKMDHLCFKFIFGFTNEVRSLCKEYRQKCDITQMSVR